VASNWWEDVNSWRRLENTMPGFTQWARDYEAEHGFLPGAGNDENLQAALSNRAWGNAVQETTGRAPTNREWLIHYGRPDDDRLPVRDTGQWWQQAAEVAASAAEQKAAKTIVTERSQLWQDLLASLTPQQAASVGLLGSEAWKLGWDAQQRGTVTQPAVARTGSSLPGTYPGEPDTSVTYTREQLDELLLAEAERQGVGDYINVLRAIVDQESGWDPSRVNSESMATGLMQVMPSDVSDQYGGVFDTRPTSAQLLDPIANIAAGVSDFVSKLNGADGDLPLALTRYSGGYATDVYANPVLARAKYYDEMYGGGGGLAVAPDGATQDGPAPSVTERPQSIPRTFGDLQELPEGELVPGMAKRSGVRPQPPGFQVLTDPRGGTQAVPVPGTTLMDRQRALWGDRGQEPTSPLERQQQLRTNPDQLRAFGLAYQQMLEPEGPNTPLGVRMTPADRASAWDAMRQQYRGTYVDPNGVQRLEPFKESSPLGFGYTASARPVQPGTQQGNPYVPENPLVTGAAQVVGDVGSVVGGLPDLGKAALAAVGDMLGVVLTPPALAAGAELGIAALSDPSLLVEQGLGYMALRTMSPAAKAVEARREQLREHMLDMRAAGMEGTPEYQRLVAQFNEANTALQAARQEQLVQRRQSDGTAERQGLERIFSGDPKEMAIAWEAARANTYSGIGIPAYAEQRIAMGEPVEQVVQEMQKYQNFWLEMFGQGVFDPYNVVGDIGNAALRTMQIEQARWYVRHVDGSYVDALGRVTSAAAPDTALGRAAAWINPLRPTREMRQARLLNDTNNITRLLLMATTSEQEMGERLALFMADPDLAARTYGLDVLASEPGKRTAGLLNRMGDADAFRAIMSTAKEDALALPGATNLSVNVAVTEAMLRHAQKTLDEVVPRFQTLYEALAVPMQRVRRSNILFENSLDDILHTAYMGVNPGTAWRNAAGNVMPGLTDGLLLPFETPEARRAYQARFGMVSKRASAGLSAAGEQTGHARDFASRLSGGIEGWFSEAYTHRGLADTMGRLWPESVQVQMADISQLLTREQASQLTVDLMSALNDQELRAAFTRARRAVGQALDVDTMRQIGRIDPGLRDAIVRIHRSSDSYATFQARVRSEIMPQIDRFATRTRSLAEMVPEGHPLSADVNPIAQQLVDTAVGNPPEVAPASAANPRVVTSLPAEEPDLQAALARYRAGRTPAPQVARAEPPAQAAATGEPVATAGGQDWVQRWGDLGEKNVRFSTNRSTGPDGPRLDAQAARGLGEGQAAIVQQYIDRGATADEIIQYHLAQQGLFRNREVQAQARSLIDEMIAASRGQSVPPRPGVAQAAAGAVEAIPPAELEEAGQDLARAVDNVTSPQAATPPAVVASAGEQLPAPVQTTEVVNGERSTVVNQQGVQAGTKRVIELPGSRFVFPDPATLTPEQQAQLAEIRRRIGQDLQARVRIINSDAWQALPAEQQDALLRTHFEIRSRGYEAAQSLRNMGGTFRDMSRHWERVFSEAQGALRGSGDEAAAVARPQSRAPVRAAVTGSVTEAATAAPPPATRNSLRTDFAEAIRQAGFTTNRDGTLNLGNEVHLANALRKAGVPVDGRVVRTAKLSDVQLRRATEVLRGRALGSLPGVEEFGRRVREVATMYDLNADDIRAMIGRYRGASDAVKADLARQVGYDLPGGAAPAIFPVRDVVSFKAALRRVWGPLSDEELNAAITVMEGAAAYSGMNPDEFVRRFIAGVGQGMPTQAEMRYARAATEWVRELYGDDVAERVAAITKGIYPQGVPKAKAGTAEGIVAYFARNYSDNDTAEYTDRVLAFMRKGKTGKTVRPNSKTILSIDVSTECPFKDQGRECWYCYVAEPRQLQQMGAPGKHRASSALMMTEYGGELREMDPQVVSFLNSLGGMRMFSLGDYRPEQAELIQRVIDDAASVGLEIKAITKQHEFVTKYGNVPGIHINMSVDMEPEFFPHLRGPAPEFYDEMRHFRSTISNTPSVNDAYNFTREYKNVNLRYVAVFGPEEAARAIMDPRIGVVTMFHGGTNVELRMQALKTFNPKLVEMATEPILRQMLQQIDLLKPATLRNLPQNKRISEAMLRRWFGDQAPTIDQFVERAISKLCCQSGRCALCPVCCGFRAGRGAEIVHAVMAGVPIAAVEYMEDGRALIRGTQQATLGGLLHEYGHTFKAILTAEDRHIAEDALGVARDSVWSLEADESFADQFLMLMREGRAPRPELQGIFEQFKAWLADVWSKIQRTFRGDQVNPQLRPVLESLVAGMPADEAERAALYALPTQQQARRVGGGAESGVRFARSERPVGWQDRAVQYVERARQAGLVVNPESASTRCWLSPNGDIIDVERIHQLTAKRFGATEESLLADGWVRAASSVNYQVGSGANDGTVDALGYYLQRVHDQRNPYGRLLIDPTKNITVEFGVGVGGAPEEGYQVFGFTLRQLEQNDWDLPGLIAAQRRRYGLMGQADDLRFARAVDQTRNPNAVVPYGQDVATELRGLTNQVLDQARATWGKGKALDPARRRAANQALDAALPKAIRELNTAKTVAMRVGEAVRDFALHDYSATRAIDVLAKAYLMYPYWSMRSYPKWLLRAAINPAVAANYLRYKRVLHDINRDLPEGWWQDQIWVNLPGMSQPLALNLEYALNPMAGLMENWDDPNQRKTWLGRAMAAADKVGLSAHPLFAWGYSIDRALRGDTAGAESRMGYFSTATRLFKYTTGMLGLNDGLGITLEPWLWRGRPWTGADQWEWLRVAKNLGTIEARGGDPNLTRYAAHYVGTGELPEDPAIRTQVMRTVDDAIRMEVGEKGWPVVIGWAAGAAVRPRNVDDLELARAGQELSAIYEKADEMDEDQFRSAMQEFYAQRPWYRTVSLGRKRGEEAMVSWSWEVYNRMPPGPGAVRDAYIIGDPEKTGVTQEMLDQFRAHKGFTDEDGNYWASGRQMEQWQARMMDLAAEHGVPPPELTAEWQRAYDARRQMYEMLETQFPGYQTLQDRYYALRASDPTAARAYLNANPVLRQAWAAKDEWPQEHPEYAWYFADEPREQAVSVIWRIWNALEQGGLDRHNVRAALGEAFERDFLNPETADVDRVSNAQLLGWVAALGTMADQLGVGDTIVRSLWTEAPATQTAAPTEAPYVTGPEQMGQQPAGVADAGLPVGGDADGSSNPEPVAADPGTAAGDPVQPDAGGDGQAQLGGAGGDGEETPLQLADAETNALWVAYKELLAAADAGDAEAKAALNDRQFDQFRGPAARPWRVYYDTIAPGWRTQDAGFYDDPLISRWMDPATRDSVDVNDVVARINELHRALPGVRFGDPAEYEQARAEQDLWLEQAAALMPRTMAYRQARLAFAEEHPTWARYYLRPTEAESLQSYAAAGWKYQDRGSGGGGGGGGGGLRYRYTGRRFYPTKRKHNIPSPKVSRSNLWYELMRGGK
jgi:hypothetical protein